MRWAPRAVAGLSIAYVGSYGTLCWIKWRYFLYRDFDLAIFAQAIQSVLRGSFHSSIRGMAWLGDHASLVLVPLAPLLAPFRHAFALLVLQTLALGLGAIPVYRLARRELSRPTLAVAMAGAYLLFPALGYCNLFEFHPETLATPALLWALERLSARRPRGMLLCAALALACREDVALAVLVLAVMTGFTWRWQPAVAMAGLAVASLVVSFGLLRPLYQGGEADYANMYRALGASPGEIARNLVVDPISAVGTCFSTPGDPVDSALKRSYFMHLFLPVLFLPLLSPLSLAPALPIMAEHLLSSRTPQHTIAYQYTALVTPFVMVAALRGLRRLEPRLGTLARGWLLPGMLVAAGLGSQGLFGPLVDVPAFRVVSPRERVLPSADDRAMRPYRESALARVPSAGGVVAGFEFLARLSGRDSVHALHHVLTGAYTFSRKPYATPAGVVALLADWSDPQTAAYLGPGAAARVRELRVQNRLRPAWATRDLLLFLRDARDTVELVTAARQPPAAPAHATFDQQLVYLGCNPVSGRRVAGDDLVVRTWWRREAVVDRLFTLEIGLFDHDRALRSSQVRDLGYGFAPTAEWPPETTVIETWRHLIPAGLEPGRYLVAARVFSRRAVHDLTLAVPDDATRSAGDGSLLLGEIEVVARGSGPGKRAPTPGNHSFK